MSFWRSARSAVLLRSCRLSKANELLVRVKGRLANVRLIWALMALSRGLIGCLSVPFSGSLAEPQSGSGSSSTGTPIDRAAFAATLIATVLGCLTHWVEPDCPAIIAIAFGLEGPMIVWKMLSKRANLLA